MELRSIPQWTNRALLPMGIWDGAAFGHLTHPRGEQGSSGKTSVSGGKAPAFKSRLPQMPSPQNTERDKYSSGLWFCISSVIQRVIGCHWHSHGVVKSLGIGSWHSALAHCYNDAWYKYQWVFHNQKPKINSNKELLSKQTQVSPD